jgi:CDP-diacylglycerol--glycerol-3-phosphate 3-phosphatidyltransferase
VKSFSHTVGRLFVRARDAVAAALVRCHVSPNAMTLLGLALTLTAAVFMAFGHWLAAGLILVAAGACDMLDGAVARVADRRTAFGGILDSTCDRIGDVALMASLAAYYLLTWPAARGAPPNLTYALLAVLGIVNSTLVSYIRARAEPEAGDCNVGFWRRGERYAAVMIGALARNPAMLLWQMGAGVALTALYRLVHVRRALAGRGGAPRSPAERVILFAEPRRTWACDLYTGLMIALLVVARIPETDLVRRLFEAGGG